MKQIKYIFLLSIIFFACDEINIVNDFSNNYTFLCVLKNNQVTQNAYLYNILDMESDFSYNTFDNDFIRDAEIIMSDGTISSQMQVRVGLPNSESITYSDDSVFHGRILPNKKYDIQIKVNNEIITGSTTTPGEFAINIPINNTIDLNDADKEYTGSSLIYKYRLSWGKSANSSHYVVYSTITYENEGEYYSNYYLQHEPIYTADTFAVIDIPEVHPSVWDVGYYPISARIVIISVDKNYYEYNILKRDRAGLSSQYGVFGSTISDSCIVDIR
jgi:hypothetical protein